ncbi:MAG: deferrochelatase/peroxidase EfeB [Rhodoferax sp.]|nr:deferrochelatase/peroxidase EfeB [Rhodoferax sp.]
MNMHRKDTEHATAEAPSLPRRQWLTQLAGVGVAGLALGSGRVAQAATAPSAEAPQVADAPRSDQTQNRQPFFGAHQSGIVTPRPAAGLVASFDVLADNRAELRRLFVTLTERIAFLTQGGAQPDLDPRLPPAGSGILGPVVSPDNLTVTVSVGDALFDERFGLAHAKPARLQPMTGFKNDALDEELCHGDISLQFCANTPDTNIHALRDIVKNLPDLLVLRWKQEGSVPPVAAQPGKPPQSARNFLGFRDGSANPDSADAALMNRIVWVQPGTADEPAWAAHGSYQAVRIIRNFVERWDRTPLQEQEAIMGRHKATGAPLDSAGSHAGEHDLPDYANDSEGARIGLQAHIRLANPRTPGSETSLILRRPFNYSNGVSKSGQLEMGLLFIAYQADLEAGFITVQKRLNNEPLEEYIKPIGGGYFFTLPGISTAGDFLGRSLLEAAGA